MLKKIFFIIVCFVFCVQLNVSYAVKSNSLLLKNISVNKNKIKSLISDLIDEQYSKANRAEKKIYDKITNYVDKYDYNKKTIVNKKQNKAHLEPKNKSQLYHFLGIQAILKNKFNPSLWCFANAVKENKYKNNTIESVNYLVETATVLTFLNEKDKALKILAYTERGKKLDNVYAAIGSIYGADNNKDGAIKAYARAIKYSKGEISDLYLERLHFFLKNFNKAVEELRTNAIKKCDDYLKADELPNLDSTNIKTWLANQVTITSNVIQRTKELNGMLNSLDIPIHIKSSFLNIVDNYLKLFDKRREQLYDYIHQFSDEADREYQKYEKEMDACTQSSTNRLAPKSGGMGNIFSAFCQCPQEYFNKIRDYSYYTLYPRCRGKVINYLFDTRILLDYFEYDTLYFIHSHMDEIPPTEAFKLHEFLYEYYYFFCTGQVSSMYGALAEPMVTEDGIMLANGMFQMCGKMGNLGNSGGSNDNRKKEQVEDIKEVVKTAKHLKKKTALPKFELCADDIGCIGSDNGYLSVKVGGFGGKAFAQFSLNPSKVDLVIKVGLGISDPTGNLGGLDLSVEGGIGKSGSRIAVKGSYSGGVGTITKDLTIFAKENKW